MTTSTIPATMTGKETTVASKLTLAVHQEEGMYWAEVQEMPGCFASGVDLNELMDAVREAVSLYLTDGEGVVEIDGFPGQPTPTAAAELADLVALRAMNDAYPPPHIDVASMNLLVEA
jgi:predicted RNase H-like HicB family nuclease